MDLIYYRMRSLFGFNWCIGRAVGVDAELLEQDVLLNMIATILPLNKDLELFCDGLDDGTADVVEVAVKVALRDFNANVEVALGEDLVVLLLSWMQQNTVVFLHLLHHLHEFFVKFVVVQLHQTNKQTNQSVSKEASD